MGGCATLHLLNFLMSQSAGVSPFDSINPGGAVPFYLMLYRAGEVHETHPLRKPAFEARVVPQVVEREIRLEYSFLRQFSRNLFVCYHAQGNAFDHLLVTFDKLPKGVFIACTC